MLAAFQPTWFALVMATGIVSIGAKLLGWNGLAGALLALNLACFVAIWAMTAARAALAAPAVRADLAHPARSAGFFAMAPAVCVVGTQLHLITGGWVVPAGLWTLAGAVGVTATGLVARAWGRSGNRPPFQEWGHGGWLLPGVGLQAFAILGTQVALSLPAGSAAVLRICLCGWIGGAAFYLCVGTLLTRRIIRNPPAPEAFTPATWILMGGAAISATAALSLLGVAEADAWTRAAAPALRVAAVALWIVATAWWPVLVAFGVWRHLLRRVPVRFEPAYWSAIFPVGMYAVATVRLAHAMAVPALLSAPRVVVPLALGAWTLAAVGVVRPALSPGAGAGAAAPTSR